MDRRALREFASRDRTAVAAERRRFRREEFARKGAAATVAASVILWQHMRAVRPEWPTEKDRAADLDAHLALKRALDRAAHAFPLRRPPA